MTKKQLLEYLWETVYKDSFIAKSNYNLKTLAVTLLLIPSNKQDDAVKFCIKAKVPLETVSTIFETIDKLNNLGTDYADKHYNKYYSKVIDAKKLLEDYTSTSNPIIISPLDKPTTMMYEAIRRTELVSKYKDEFLALFDRHRSPNSNTLTAEMILQDKLHDKIIIEPIRNIFKSSK